jgi:hypothetical protein
MHSQSLGQGSTTDNRADGLCSLNLDALAWTADHQREKYVMHHCAQAAGNMPASEPSRRNTSIRGLKDNTLGRVGSFSGFNSEVHDCLQTALRPPKYDFMTHQFQRCSFTFFQSLRTAHRFAPIPSLLWNRPIQLWGIVRSIECSPANGHSLGSENGRQLIRITEEWRVFVTMRMRESKSRLVRQSQVSPSKEQSGDNESEATTNLQELRMAYRRHSKRWSLAAIECRDRKAYSVTIETIRVLWKK